MTAKSFPASPEGSVPAPVSGGRLPPSPSWWSGGSGRRAWPVTGARAPCVQSPPLRAGTWPTLARHAWTCLRAAPGDWGVWRRTRRSDSRALRPGGDSSEPVPSGRLPARRAPASFLLRGARVTAMPPCVPRGCLSCLWDDPVSVQRLLCTLCIFPAQCFPRGVFSKILFGDSYRLREAADAGQRGISVTRLPLLVTSYRSVEQPRNQDTGPARPGRDQLPDRERTWVLLVFAHTPLSVFLCVVL